MATSQITNIQPMDIRRSFFEKRVAAGIKLLDTKVPGWHKRIDLKRLDLDSIEDCILGQLWGNFGDGMRALGLLFNGSATACAFAGPPLTETIWRRAIKKLQVPASKRIGWFDSAGQPARIHLTVDDGQTTLCGHQPLSKHQAGRWRISMAVPRTQHGRSRYCHTCFERGGKNRPWFDVRAAALITQ